MCFEFNLLSCPFLAYHSWLGLDWLGIVMATDYKQWLALLKVVILPTGIAAGE